MNKNKAPEYLWIYKDVKGKNSWIADSEPTSSSTTPLWIPNDDAIYIGLDYHRDYLPWLAPGTAVKLQVTSVVKRHLNLNADPAIEGISTAIQTLQKLKKLLEEKS